MKGAFERLLIKKKHRYIAGIDEVGRGALAGDLYIGCVILDYNKLFDLDKNYLDKIRDSKTLSKKQRKEILPVIKSISIDYQIGIAKVKNIENMGLTNAIVFAVEQALSNVKLNLDLILLDGGLSAPNIKTKQINIVKGDALCYCISAASILAKESRDDYMINISDAYPFYKFEKHVGYATKFHLKMLETHGPCKIHRKKFSPIKDMIV